jgi:hypothetical protein
MRKLDKIAITIYKNLGADGLLHVIFSAILFKVLWLMFGWLLAALLTLGIGYGKEKYDAFTGGKVDRKDLWCDGLGILFGILMNL